MNRRALGLATLIGVIAQAAMVIAGHYASAIAQMFAVGGMGISLIAGLLFSALARPPLGSAALGGGIAGGVCAFLGIGLSLALHDVGPSVLVFGTAASLVTGVIGGLVGRMAFRRQAT